MGLLSLFKSDKQSPGRNDGVYRSSTEEDTNHMQARRRGEKSARTPKTPDDPILPEKKRARRRLVGAIALVLTVIVVLPMLLDSEPKPIISDIAIQIPPKDTAPREEPREPTVASHSTDTAAKANSSKAEEAPVVTTPVVKEPTPVKEVATVKESVPVKEAVADKESQAAKETAAADKARAGAKDEAARAMAILEGKAVDEAAKKAAATANSTTEKKNEKFVLQVAALATQEKVDQIRSQLNGAGINSFTQKVATESGDRIRIRVGPFTSKEQAENTQKKIIKLGLKATLVPM